MAIKNTMSVHIDDEITLALTQLREELKKNNVAAGMPATAPSIGWLARAILRDKFGLVGSNADKQDISALSE